jgi:uncharacterized protein YyaL (SSP411 family)
MVHRSVLRSTAARLRTGPLPLLLAETLPQLPRFREKESFAVICRSTQCLPPVSTPEELRAALRA